MTGELLKEIAKSVPIPAVAIGGIDENNAGKLKGLPIAGIAVVSGIFGKTNVRMGATLVRAALYGRPVVQCITNHVTVNDVANLILSMGASPIMAHHIREVSEVQENASALLVNLGATDDYDAMKEAVKTASGCGHPIVIDPVGTGVSSYRREQLRALLDIAPPACIRGNFSEILSLYEDRATLKGLDDDITTDEHGISGSLTYVRDDNNMEYLAADKKNTDSNLQERMEIVSRCASRYNTIVAATGTVDIISDGSRTVCVSSGHPMQRRITGSGCMLSAAIASVFAISPADRMALTEGVCRYMGRRAEQAASEVILQDSRKAISGQNDVDCGGSMSFKLRFMDSI